MPSSSRQAMALTAETTSIFNFKHILFKDKGSMDKASYIFCPVSSPISRDFVLFSTISLLLSFSLIFKSYCKSEIMSRDVSKNFAPCLKREFVALFLPTGKAGAAKISLFCSNANLHVISEPLLYPASITAKAFERPAIFLFIVGKFFGSGA